VAEQVILPKQGQSVETCLILSWKKREGDPIREGETLVEVETDKAAFEVPSTAGGTVLKLLRAEGEDVPVLAALAVVGQPGEDISGLLSPQPRAETGVAGPRVAAAGANNASAAAAGAPGLAAASAVGSRPRISPRARRLAQNNGLDGAGVLAALASGRGSGPGGRILEQDVRAALNAPPGIRPGAAAPSAAATTLSMNPGERPPDWAGPVTETPVKGVRKLIAERMLASLQSSAQYTLHASADGEALLALRRRLKDSPEELGLGGITINDLVNYAVSRVLLRFAELNALFDGAVLSRFERVHLGVAVDTPRGLMVPVVRDAGRLSLRSLAAETARLQRACLGGTVTPEELSGGTFTVTNLGPMGIEGFTPVLNPPQVAILGVGGMQLRPVQTDAGVAFRQHLSLSLTANHQVVDGAPAARFLRALGGALERFELLLL